MTEVQPMKMAAAEALYETADSAPFSVLSIGSLDGSEERFPIIQIPGLLSFLATGSFDGTVEGINDLQVRAVWPSRSAESRPESPLVVDATLHRRSSRSTYWSFRFMIGLGLLSALVAAASSSGRTRGAEC